MPAAFDRQRPSGVAVASYGPGWFELANGARLSGIALIGTGGATTLAPRAIDMLTPTDLAALLDADPAPELLLIGTGATMKRLPGALAAALGARGLPVEPMDTRAAARTYNVLLLEERRVAAVLWPV